MLNLAEQHARMIRSFEVRYGRERVEKLLDALLTVATSVNAFERSGPELKKRLIYYLEERAPLEDFERILLESIREEAEYFDLIQRTHIINEGWATFVEAELLNRLLTAKEWATISVQPDCSNARRVGSVMPQRSPAASSVIDEPPTSCSARSTPSPNSGRVYA